MATLKDKEFGPVAIRRSRLSRNVRLSVAPNGTLRISMPPYAPLFLAKRLISASRDEIRSMLKPLSIVKYADGMQIGKSHRLAITHGEARSIRFRQQAISVQLGQKEDPGSQASQQYVREGVIKALRREANSYLPKRLDYLAATHGFDYAKVRFSHASSRWGSCSSNGTISLNIALMKLPFELIDYVLIHELAHTKHMNHSQDFWQTVEAILPDYKVRRKEIKQETPSV